MDTEHLDYVTDSVWPCWDVESCPRYKGIETIPKTSGREHKFSITMAEEYRPGFPMTIQWYQFK